ncbi:MAG: NeuD/PglB/VioB family sugar acetyltransferase [Pseudomonadota bacterium]
MKAPGPLVILGFGGHARSVADIALACGHSQLVFVDDHARDGETFLGHPAVREYPAGHLQCMPAAGDNALRRRQLEVVQAQAFELITLIAPGATTGAGAVVQPGTLVARHAHIGPLAEVGRGCIINTGAVVDHESRIGEFCHISVNATVAGRCVIGAGVFVCAGATVIDGVTIAPGIIVGAGATVVHDLTEPGTYVGTPARLVRR